MAKKEAQRPAPTGADANKQVLLIFMVSIVAILAILAASQQTNIGGEAAYQNAPQCEEDNYCINWKVERSDLPECLEYSIEEYKSCSKYSFPPDESGKPVMTCDTWDIMYDRECAQWSTEVEWVRKCTEWKTVLNCASEE